MKRIVIVTFSVVVLIAGAYALFSRGGLDRTFHGTDGFGNEPASSSVVAIDLHIPPEHSKVFPDDITVLFRVRALSATNPLRNNFALHGEAGEFIRSTAVRDGLVYKFKIAVQKPPSSMPLVSIDARSISKLSFATPRIVVDGRTMFQRTLQMPVGVPNKLNVGERGGCEKIPARLAFRLDIASSSKKNIRPENKYSLQIVRRALSRDEILYPSNISGVFGAEKFSLTGYMPLATAMQATGKSLLGAARWEGEFDLEGLRERVVSVVEAFRVFPFSCVAGAGDVNCPFLQDPSSIPVYIASSMEPAMPDWVCGKASLTGRVYFWNSLVEPASSVFAE